MHRAQRRARGRRDSHWGEAQPASSAPQFLLRRRPACFEHTGRGIEDDSGHGIDVRTGREIDIFTGRWID